MLPEKIYADSLLGMSAVWTPKRIAEDDVEYLRSDVASAAEANAYYRGLAHGKQSAASLILAMRDSLERAHNWIGGRMLDHRENLPDLYKRVANFLEACAGTPR